MPRARSSMFVHLIENYRIQRREPERALLFIATAWDRRYSLSQLVDAEIRYGLQAKGTFIHDEQRNNLVCRFRHIAPWFVTAFASSKTGGRYSRTKFVSSAATFALKRCHYRDFYHGVPMLLLRKVGDVQARRSNVPPFFTKPRPHVGRGIHIFIHRHRGVGYRPPNRARCPSASSSFFALKLPPRAFPSPIFFAVKKWHYKNDHPGQKCHTPFASSDHVRPSSGSAASFATVTSACTGVSVLFIIRIRRLN